MEFRKKWDFQKLLFIGYLLSSLFAFYRLFFRSPAEHFDLFVTAGKLLLEGKSPYGAELNPIGRWFYSPSCGLFLFGPLSFLPKVYGLFLFISASWVAFIYGVLAWIKKLSIKKWGLLFLLLLPQTFSAIWSCKIELLSTGLLLLLMSKLMEEGKSKGADYFYLILLAGIGDWKFQTIPATGLLFLSWIIFFKKWSWAPVFLISLLAHKFILPLFWFSPSELLSMYRAQAESLNQFMAVSLFNFDNIFNFFHSALGFTIAYENTIFISLCVAMGMIFYVTALSRKYLHIQNINAEASKVAITALAFGGVFSMLFNPISQNNAYIQVAPLLLAGMVALENLQVRVRHLLLIGGGLGWAIVAFAYSDLFSKVLRPLTIKPLGVVLLFAVVAEAMVKMRNQEMRRF